MSTGPRKGFDNTAAAQNRGIPVSGMWLTDTKISEHRNVGGAGRSDSKTGEFLPVKFPVLGRVRLSHVGDVSESFRW